MCILWILTAIAATLLTYLLYSNVSKKKSYWEKRGVRSVQQTVFSFLYVLWPKKPLSDGVVEMYKLYEGEKYYGYTIMNTPILMVRDPEIINLVLIKDFAYFQDRNVPMNDELDLVNTGLANVTGDKWRVLRHKLTPTFTTGKMKMMVKHMKECSDDLVQFVKSKNGADVETRDLLFKFIINVIGNIAFGIKVDALNEEKQKDNKFLEMSQGFFKPSMFLQLKLVLFLVAPKLKEFLGVRLSSESHNQFFTKFVKDLINYRKQNNERRNDFLQLMIDQKEKELALINSASDTKDDIVHSDSEVSKYAEEPEDMELLKHLKSLKYDKNSLVFSDNIIAAQTFLFISGGSDGTATILSFVLHYLAVHQDVQRKLQAEIDAIFTVDELSFETIKKMKYMEQVLYEVLRLRTTGGVVSRICVQDYKMPGTDLIIEKGTIVQVPVIGLHTDPQYFPDPENFDPDRFKDIESIPKGVFFPFGAGPRMCIAMRLALLEMKVCVATLLRSCNVLQSEKTPLPLIMDPTSFSQHVKGGLWVKFEERQI